MGKQTMNNTESTFIDRFSYLARRKGFDISEHGAIANLGRAIYENEHSPEGDSADLIARAIRKQLKTGCDPTIHYIKMYCRYFDCTSDFLLGLESQPKHTTTDIYGETGLSDSAVEIMQEFYMDDGYFYFDEENEKKLLASVSLSNVLNALIEADEFRQTLMLISHYLGQTYMKRYVACSNSPLNKEQQREKRYLELVMDGEKYNASMQFFKAIKKIEEDYLD